MEKRKWIAYGVTGAVGVGIVAGGAAVAANAMEIRTIEGTTLPGGAIVYGDAKTADKGAIATGKMELRDTGTSVSVVTPPSATTAPSVASPPAPSPVTPPSPVTQPSPITQPSPVTPPSPATPPSPVSAPSPASAP